MPVEYDSVLTLRVECHTAGARRENTGRSAGDQLVTKANGQGRSDRRYAVASTAIRLFAERGLDETTVEDIAAAADVSSRTFFRYFTSKESAAFPDHADRVADLRQRLESRRPSSAPFIAALDVCRQSALKFFDEPDLYRTRYRLVRSVAALRNFERIADAAYEEVIAEFIVEETASDPLAILTAKAFAASVVSVVNYALDVWATEDDADAPGVLEAGLRMLGTRFSSAVNNGEARADVNAQVDLILVIPGSDELRSGILKMIDGSHLPRPS
jgi:AcrR family transcriptional regulator